MKSNLPPDSKPTIAEEIEFLAWQVTVAMVMTATAMEQNKTEKAQECFSMAVVYFTRMAGLVKPDVKKKYDAMSDDLKNAIMKAVQATTTE